MTKLNTSEVQRVAQLLAYLDIQGLHYHNTTSAGTLWRDLTNEQRAHYRDRAEWFLARYHAPVQRASQPGPVPRQRVVQELEIVAS